MKSLTEEKSPHLEMYMPFTARLLSVCDLPWINECDKNLEENPENREKRAKKKYLSQALLSNF